MNPTHFTLALLCPPATESPFPAPAFIDDKEAWHQAFEGAVLWGGEGPFAELLRRQPWWARAPGEIQVRAERARSREHMRLALLEEEETLATEALEQQGVPYLRLKGADLARRYYPQRILRPMRDVDLWVAPENQRSAEGALRGAGFAPLTPAQTNRGQQEWGREGRPAVELHWRLGGWEQSGTSLWEGSDPGPWGGFGRALGPRHLLPYLLFHGSIQHRWDSPLWLMDLYYVARQDHGRIPWETLLPWAHKVGATGALWCLHRWMLAWRLGGLPLPVHQALQRRLSPLRRALLGRLAEPTRLFREPAPRLWEVLWRRTLFADSPQGWMRWARRQGTRLARGNREETRPAGGSRLDPISQNL